MTAAKKRSGYTLLELMLALALLGALLTVAWSLMGTYRDAEQKGWQLSMRVQTVRALHSWLQQDLDHIATSDAVISHFSPQASDARPPQNRGAFSGTSIGFTMTSNPSLAPLPFLERLMGADGTATFDEVQPPVMLDLGTSSLGNPPTSSTSVLWPDETVQVEYQLAPVARSSNDQSLTAFNDVRETHYRLIRTVRRSDAEVPSTSTFPSDEASMAADRVLTAQDLYRQNDESETRGRGPVLEEAVLHGLVNARFRYSDGRGWVDEWASTNTSPPRAVALSFDLSRQFEPIVASMASMKEVDAAELDGFADELAFAEAALSSEPIAEIDTVDARMLAEDETYQVQIVIRINGLPDHLDEVRFNSGPALSPPATEIGR